MATALDPVLRHIRHLVPAPAARASDDRLLGRFLAAGDDDAFAALVGRHGPMVWGVCRRVLGNGPDADDAFQATFVVLARKAGAIRRRQSVASWLYGVAVRVSRKAQTAALRRRRHERRAAVPAWRDDGPAADWHDVRPVLDEEVGRLPAKYRLPVVLCYVEGLTHQEAARRLGWAGGTVAGRLARARDLLRRRLVRRGLTLSAGALAATLAADPVRAGSVSDGVRTAVPAALRHVTTEAARQAVGRGTTTGAPSAAVLALARSTLRGMFLAKLQAAAVLLVTAILTAGAGAVFRLAAEPPPAGQPAPPPATTAAAPPRLDHFGDPLPAGALARLGTMRLRQGGTVTAVAFAPDGKTVASGGWDGRARLWDVATGRPLGQLDAQAATRSRFTWIESLAFSADGKALAVGTGNGAACVLLWNIATPGEPRRLDGHRASVYGVAFRPDGKTLVSAGRDGTIRHWDLATARELRQTDSQHGSLRHLAISRDGQTLATAGDDRKVRLWDAATGALRRELDGDDPERGLALSADGRLLAVAGRERVRLWDMATGKALRAIDEPLGMALAFVPGRNVLAVGSQGRSITLWDVHTGKERGRLQGHEHAVVSLAFAGDGSTLASGAWDHTVRLWDVAAGKPLHPAHGHEHDIYAIAFAPDGKSVVTASDDSTVRTWEPATGKLLRTDDFARYLPVRHGNRDVREREPNGVRWLAFSPDGRTLAVTDGAVRLLDRAHHQEVRRFQHPGERHDRFAFSPDGRLLATAGYGSEGRHTIRLWDPATGKERRLLADLNDFVRDLAFTPDGRNVVAATQERAAVLHVLDAAGGPGRQIAADFDMLLAFAVAPDGSAVAVGGVKFPVPASPALHPVLLLDLATGKERRRFASRHGAALQLLFSADGKSLAAATEDGGVSLWEVATGADRGHWAGHIGPISALAFAPDARSLASAARDTTALVWDLTGLATGQTAEHPRLSPPDWDARWADLADPDGARAYRALWLLAADPKTLPRLRERLRPVRPGDERKIAQLVRDLGSDRFAVRQHAAEELQKQADAAEHALRQTLDGHAPLEVRRHVEQLLARLDTPTGDRLRSLRAGELLERVATPEARALLQTLAAGLADARLTHEAAASLRRLARIPTD